MCWSSWLARRWARAASGGSRGALAAATICAFAAALTPALRAAKPEDLTRILVLYSHGKDFPSNVQFERGLQTALRSAPRGSVDYFPEFLEPNRFPGDEQSRTLHDYLRRKYADRRIDVVVAPSSTSLDFLLEFRDDLFARSPIVFHTVASPVLSGVDTRASVTGVTADAVFRKTVQAALALHPRTREVLVVVDTSGRNGTLEADVRAELDPLETQVRLTYLSDLPLSDLMARVTAAPAGSVIFYAPQPQDIPGSTSDPSDLLALVAGAAPVPVYSLSGALLGRGSVGGYTIDLESVGTAAGQMALQLAAGMRPSDIAITAVPSVAMFDARQLRRWGLRESRLPAGSVVMFRDPPFLGEYRKYAVAALAVFAVQLALIGGLLIQRVKRRRAEESLRRSEARYRSVIDTQTELICRFRPDTTLTFVNDAYCRYWRMSRRDLLGRSFLELIPPEARDHVREGLAALEAGGVNSQEHPVFLPGGGIGWQHWIDRAIVDADGRITEVQSVGRDVTDRKEMEDALSRSQARTSAILRVIPDLMFIMTPDGTYIDYYARDATRLFVPPERFIGRNVRDILPPDLATLIMSALDQAWHSNEPVIVEYELPVAGELTYNEARLVRGDDGRILIIVRDISEARRASARNRDLAGRLIASQEMERQRIARELHDNLSQKLALMSIDIDELRSVVSERERALRLRQLSERAAEIGTDVQELSRDLHPSRLQTLGLVAALEALCRDVSQIHHLRVEFTCEDPPRVVGPDVSLCLYRITQEALHNIVRHSGARQALVRLERDDDELSLQVADQGIGFDPRDTEGEGLGLLSMRERVAYLGGRLAIHSTRGGGTRIGVRVPIEAESRRLPRAQSA